ncbi:M1 family metallopeptidase [Candidatus Saccharibacteria bacterium]|nr:M1 family metallopeptidase [Candidatus Saccharibacteria bacterium]
MERLIEYFVPEKYKLDLTIDKLAKTIGGKVLVKGEALRENVKFHAVELKIERVLVNGEKGKFKCDGKILEILDVVPGEAEIEISYHGNLNENMEGAYLSSYEYKGHTEWIVATQFESHYAREAFPCIDEPAAKAVFELVITTAGDDKVLANTPVKNVVKNTTYFEETPKMSTYLLAWVIGEFHGRSVKNKHGVEIATYAPLNQDIDSVDFANEVAAKALDYYDDNFGVPYPLKKLDQVALPDFEAGAMENWGLVTYRESMLLVSKNATLGTKKGVALTVTHELAHQWFGDLVTMEWWDDLWLNESFASVMEYYATDYIHPEYKIFENFFVGDALAALRRDAYSGVQSVHQEVHNPEEIATLFDPAIVYAKGARLMLMLIRVMGWEDFCKGLKDYFEKYKYKNTVGDDLWKALDKYADFDVRKLMHSFIDEPGYPVVESKNGKGNFREYVQRRFLIDGEMRQSEWPIPEVLEDMSGHYILNLSEVEFEARLARFDELTLEEKLRLLIDKSLIVKTDLASAASLLPLVKKFENENSAAVWSIVSFLIGTLKPFFEYGSKEQKKFAEFVGKLVAPKLKEIGLMTNEGDDENTLRLRAILLALDYYAETLANLEALAGMYEKDLSKMDKEIRADILDAKIYCEPAVMSEFLEAYKTNADPELKYELLFAMTLSHDAENICAMIKLLNDIETVKPQDQFYLFLYLYRNPFARKEVFEWLTKNWDFVKKLAGDKSIENYPRYIANSIRTEEEKKAYKDFFGPMKDDAALARAIAIGLNEIDAQLKLIRKDKKSVYRALDAIM